MKFHRKLFFIFLLLLSAVYVDAQEDSSSVKKDTSLFMKGIVSTNGKDTVPKHSPRKAAIRSAIIPGWGQIYNKKYWKVPIVYTAIGVPAYLFFDNKKWYERTKYAYAVAVEPNPSQDSLNKVHPDLLPFVERKSTTTLINYRNEFRRNMDYCVLFFLLAWALNIVDATVDAHLKDFNVTPDLSLRLKPMMSTNNYGIGLALDFHKAKTPVKDITR